MTNALPYFWILILVSCFSETSQATSLPSKILSLKNTTLSTTKRRQQFPSNQIDWILKSGNQHSEANEKAVEESVSDSIVIPEKLRPSDCSHFPVHCAASNGDLTYVQTSVEQLGFDPALRDKDGYQVFHYAVANNHIDIVHFLLKVGDWSNSGSPFGASLHIAVRWKRIELIKVLITAGADPFRLHQEQTPWDIAFEMGLDYLVSLKSLIPKFPNGLKESPLHTAVKTFPVNAIKALIAAGFSTEVRDKYNRTPLDYFFRSSNLPIELLEELYSFGMRTSTSLFWEVLGSHRFKNKYIGVQKALELEPSSANTLQGYPKNGQSPLEYIIIEEKYRNLALVKLLISAGAQVYPPGRHKYRQPIWYFLNQNNFPSDLRNFLLNEKLLDLEVFYNGQNYLGSILAQEHINLIKLEQALQTGSNPNVAQNGKNSQRPLILAMQNGVTNIAIDATKILFNYGAEPNFEFEYISKYDKHRLYRPLDFVANEPLRNKTEFLKILINAGSRGFSSEYCSRNKTLLHAFTDNLTELYLKILPDINTPYCGHPPLHWAIASLNPKAIQILIDNGAEFKTDTGYQSFKLLDDSYYTSDISLGKIKKMLQVLEGKIDPGQLNSKNQSIFHFIGDWFQRNINLNQGLELVEYLKNRGFDFNHRNAFGHSALFSFVSSSCSPSALKLFVAGGANVNLTEPNSKNIGHYCFWQLNRQEALEFKNLGVDFAASTPEGHPILKFDNRHIDKLEWRLKDLDLGHTYVDSIGETLGHKVVHAGNPSSVLQVINAGYMSELPRNDGKTPHDIAVEKHFPIIETMLELPPKESDDSLNFYESELCNENRSRGCKSEALIELAGRGFLNVVRKGYYEVHLQFFDESLHFKWTRPGKAEITGISPVGFWTLNNGIYTEYSTRGFIVNQKSFPQVKSDGRVVNENYYFVDKVFDHHMGRKVMKLYKAPTNDLGNITEIPLDWPLKWSDVSTINSILSKAGVTFQTQNGEVWVTDLRGKAILKDPVRIFSKKLLGMTNKGLVYYDNDYYLSLFPFESKTQKVLLYGSFDWIEILPDKIFAVYKEPGGLRSTLYTYSSDGSTRDQRLFERNRVDKVTLSNQSLVYNILNQTRGPKLLRYNF